MSACSSRGCRTGRLLPPPVSTLQCVDAATGKVLWRRERTGRYHAALLRTGDNKLVPVSATLSFADFDAADEIFVVGNYGKVTPVRRIDGRDLQPGPAFRRARELYWAFAHSG